MQNIQNLQEAVNLQQTFTTVLCGLVNTIYAKLAQLEKQIQTHCIYPHTQSDAIQINAPDYDSNIDGHIDPLPHAENNQAEPTSSANNPDGTVPSQDPNRAAHSTLHVQDPAESIEEHPQQQEVSTLTAHPN